MQPYNRRKCSVYSLKADNLFKTFYYSMVDRSIFKFHFLTLYPNSSEAIFLLTKHIVCITIYALEYGIYLWWHLVIHFILRIFIVIITELQSLEGTKEAQWGSELQTQIPKPLNYPEVRVLIGFNSCSFNYL